MYPVTEWKLALNMARSCTGPVSWSSDFRTLGASGMILGIDANASKLKLFQLSSTEPFFLWTHRRRPTYSAMMEAASLWMAVACVMTCVARSMLPVVILHIIGNVNIIYNEESIFAHQVHSEWCELFQWARWLKRKVKWTKERIACRISTIPFGRAVGGFHAARTLVGGGLLAFSVAAQHF